MSRAAIAHCIRHARQARNMTQQQLADEMGLNQRTIDAYEQEVINIPSERLMKLAEIFAIHPGEFYDYACPCLTIVESPVFQDRRRADRRQDDRRQENRRQAPERRTPQETRDA